jgi:pyruvate ferredoxin oxidoreductase gamma subunit
MKILGKPIINTLILGMFAGRTKLVSLESLKKAVDQVFEGDLATKNKKAVEEAYNEAR